MTRHLDAYTSDNPPPDGVAEWAYDSQPDQAYRAVVIGRYSITAVTSGEDDEEQP